MRSSSSSSPALLLLLTLAAVLALPSAGCSDSSAGQDAGLDGRARDARRDGAADADAGVAPDDGGDGAVVGDGAVDFPRYEASPDVLVSDAALSSGTVLYAYAATDTDQIGLRTVAADGTGSPTPVSGFSGLVDFDSLDLAQQKLYLDIDPTRAGVHPSGPMAGLRLPNGAGDIYYFHRKLTGTSGLLLVAADGTVTVLLEVFGLYQDVIARHVGLSADGKVGLAVESNNTGSTDKLHAFRTDGTTFSNGKSALQLALPAGLTRVVARSLTVTKGQVLAVTTDAKNFRALLRGPADGSAALVAVPLPVSDGKKPAWISDELAISADGSTVAFAAGANSGIADVYVLDVQSGAARNLTKSPAIIAGRGADLGFFSGLMAVSPSGKRVAYVERGGGGDELDVVDASGSAAPVRVTTDTAFDPAITRILNVVWPDDDNVLFMAGVTSTQLDLYRFDAKAGTPSSLTKRGGSTAPFNGYGEFSTRGLWLSPNRKWLYFLGYEPIVAESRLHAVDLTSYAAKLVHRRGDVDTSSGSLVACPTSGALYYVAVPNTSLDQEEVYRFDQNSGSAAVRLTTFGAPTRGRWRAEDLALDSTCSTLIFSAGGSFNRRLFYRMSVSPAGPAQQLSAVPRHFASTLAFTTDGASAVYASGGASDTDVLRAVPLAGGPPTTLDPNAGFVQVLRVSK